MTISKDDFDAWRANPITQAVFAWAQDHAAKAKERWDAASWEGGEADPVLLSELRTRAEVAQDFTDVELSDIQDEEDGEQIGAPAP